MEFRGVCVHQEAIAVVAVADGAPVAGEQWPVAVVLAGVVGVVAEEEPGFDLATRRSFHLTGHLGRRPNLLQEHSSMLESSFYLQTWSPMAAT